MPSMILKASRLPQPLLTTVLDALTSFSGARAAAEKAIADAATAPDQKADVHPDEVANWQALGWQIDTSAGG